MLVYIAATLISCLLAVWCEKRNTDALNAIDSKQRWGALVLCSLPLILVSAARWGVGTDFLYTYLPEFRALQWLRAGGGDALCQELFAPMREDLTRWGLYESPESALQFFLGVLDNCEPGYRVLMEAAVALGGNFRLVIAATSVIIGLCVYYSIFTQCSAPVLAIYLYVASSNYFLSMNIIRQYIAIGIGLVAVQFIREKRLFPFLACVVVAMLFHTTAVVLLPCYFLCRVELNPRYALLLTAGVLACSGVLGTAAAWLMPRIGLGYYARYLGSAWSEDGFETMFFVINLCVLLFCGHYWNAAKQRCPYYVIWYNMTLLGTFALALSGVLPLMKRLNYYYAAPQFLLLPEALQTETDPHRRRILTGLVAAAFAAETLVAVVLLNKNEVLPYRLW